MRILIVEDDSAKLERVRQAVLALEGIDESDLVEVGDARTAKLQLRSEKFDVMIVDIVLPLRADEAPTPDGGIRLVEEVLERANYHAPQHIIGLTAYQEGLSVASRRFADRLLVAVKYESDSAVWSHAVQARLRHILAASTAPTPVESYGTDLAIVCALDTPELQMVLGMGWELDQITIPGDDTVYYAGAMEGGHSVVAAAAPRMGLPAAAVSATKMIYTHRPKLMMMTGILAGVPPHAAIGDVVVADPCWDWGSGKWFDEGGETAFLHEPHQLHLSPSMLTHASALRKDVASLAEIRAAWLGEKPQTELSVRIGPVASGASVLTTSVMTERIRNQHRKVTGIDMESYAVLVASEGASSPRPTVVSVKGVSDLADPTKNDKYRGYAAFVSARVGSALARRWLESPES